MLAPDGDLDGDAVRRELRLHRLEHGEEVRALAVEHVHEGEPGDALPLAALPHAGGRDLDAVDAVHDDERGLDDAQRRERVGLEARVAGQVDEVDLRVVPLDVGQGAGEGHLPLVLVLLPVGDRRARLDRPQAVDGPALEEQRLDERGLPRPAVADGRNIANRTGFVRHRAPSLSRFPAPARPGTMRPVTTGGNRGRAGKRRAGGPLGRRRGRLLGPERRALQRLGGASHLPPARRGGGRTRRSGARRRLRLRRDDPGGSSQRVARLRPRRRPLGRDARPGPRACRFRGRGQRQLPAGRRPGAPVRRGGVRRRDQPLRDDVLR